MDVRELTVRSGDADVFVRAAGTAPDVLVLLHGGPGISHDYLLPLVEPLLAPDLAVVVYDQRGVGRTVGPVDGDILRHLVADLDAVADAVGAERLHLLGHSGGGVTQMLAVEAGLARLASLVFVDPIAVSRAALEPAMEALNARIEEALATGAMAAPPPDADPTTWLRAVWPAYFRDPAHPAAHAPDGTTFAGAAFEAVMASLGAYDFSGTLAGVEVPALTVVCDVPFGPAMGGSVAEALPAASVRVDLDCGHMPWAEAPERFFPPVVSFLRDAR